ncbi:UNVERIFIED_CONTAM: hypothetical protein Scaly_0929200 [Sesamum calycinum]|uniref:cAMP-regulated phosphoprotein 19-related protein n=1 Tax=Sesamum calycinum TaxID=2727403 RepID=A0AAW2QYQ8_9LAMI
MAERNDETAAEEMNLVDTTPKIEEAESLSNGDSKSVDICEENQMPSKQQEDNERAFFDSADWALGKVGAQKSKGPLEALRPKLQPTPHQQVRSRSAYAPADDDGDDGDDGDSCNSDNLNSAENQSSTLDGSTESHNHSSTNQDLQI